MNKPDWVDNVFYLKFDQNISENVKVVPIIDSSKTNNNSTKEDTYNKRESKSYYGKKRRCYSDYC